MQIASVQLDDHQQAEQTASLAGQVFAAGGLVVFPTETVYGVGASATSDKGYQALRDLKGRVDQPFTVHLPDPEAAWQYVDEQDPVLQRVVRKLLPGPVTLIVDVTDEVIARKLEALGMPPSHRSRLYHQNTIGLRCPDDDLSRRILRSVDAPILASSANLPGDPPPHEAEDAVKAIGPQVQLVIDGGHSRYARPSTIIRIPVAQQTASSGSLADRVMIVREGVYDERFVRKLMRYTILLVCSGNTCRSPMAEGLARQVLAQQQGIREQDLEAHGLKVISAGAFASAGAPASAEAVEALGQMNVDISSHRSRPLTPELIHQADVIFCMTQAHRQFIIDIFPGAADKTMLLDPQGDVEDPIGSSPAVYQRCAERIRQQLVQRLKEQPL